MSHGVRHEVYNSHDLVLMLYFVSFESGSKESGAAAAEVGLVEAFSYLSAAVIYFKYLSSFLTARRCKVLSVCLTLVLLTLAAFRAVVLL